MNPPDSILPAKEEDPKPLLLQMQHCGVFEVTQKQISGWFHTLSLKAWEEIVGFHYQISLLHNAESVSYHRWNPDRKAYDTVIPYQKTIRGGLSVSTDWTDPRNVKIADDYAVETGLSLFPACTIHTHVDAPAFESGTDAHDESDWAGWHMTIGHMVKHQKYDLACRYRLPKIPGVKKLTSVERAYQIHEKHLFAKGIDMERVLTTMGNNRFAQYIERVEFPKGIPYHEDWFKNSNPKNDVASISKEP